MLHAHVSPIVDRLYQELAPTASRIAIVGPFAQRYPFVSEIHLALIPEVRADVFGDALDLLDATDMVIRILEESSFIRVNLTHKSGIYATHVRSGLPLVIHKISEVDYDRFIESAYPVSGV